MYSKFASFAVDATMITGFVTFIISTILVLIVIAALAVKSAGDFMRFMVIGYAKAALGLWLYRACTHFYKTNPIDLKALDISDDPKGENPELIVKYAMRELVKIAEANNLVIESEFDSETFKISWRLSRIYKDQND